MSFTIAVLGKFKLILHVVDLDPTDGNIRVGFELRWK